MEISFLNASSEANFVLVNETRDLVWINDSGQLAGVAANIAVHDSATPPTVFDTPPAPGSTPSNDTLDGGVGNDTIDGGAGIDTVVYSGNRSNFTITPSGNSYIVKDNTGAEGTDTLTNIERLKFPDMGVALDVVGGNAGLIAKILGAVGGAASVTIKGYVGIGLSLLDGGMSYPDLMLLVLNAKLGAGFSNADEIKLLYQNLAGVLPSTADLNYWGGAITSGQVTQTSLAVMAADLSLNTDNIHLVGLAQTGIEFTG